MKLPGLKAYKLPWVRFLEWCLLQQLAETSEYSNRPRSYRSPLWVVVRHVAGKHPEWTPDRIWVEIDKAVEKHLGGWWVWSDAWNDPASSFLETDVYDLEVAVVNAAEKCRNPGLPNMMEEALRLADLVKMAVPTNRTRSKGYKRFLCFVAALFIEKRYREVKKKKEKGIGLPQVKIAELMGVKKHHTIGGWIKWATRDGLLGCVQTYQRPGVQGRHSSSARFEITRRFYLWILKLSAMGVWHKTATSTTSDH